MPSVPFWGSGSGQSESDSSRDTRDSPYSDHPWDVASIGGFKLPGVCEVLDGLTQIGIDNKNPDGKDGSAITVKGYRPGPFEIACTVWTVSQWNILQDVISRVWRRPNKASKIRAGDALTNLKPGEVIVTAVSVYHPALELYGIASCVIQGVTFPRPGAVDGTKTVKFKCLESAPPGTKRKTKTVKPATSLIDPYVATPQSRTVAATPPKPSTQKSTTGPAGPLATPANGNW